MTTEQREFFDEVYGGKVSAEGFGLENNIKRKQVCLVGRVSVLDWFSKRFYFCLSVPDRLEL